MSEIVTGALFMFLLKESSRNAYNNDRRDAIFAKNYFRHLKLRLPHPDTIEDVMRVLKPEQLELLKAQLVSNLIEQKLFRKFRFLGTSYYVAVDATGTHTFDYKHCDHCLTKTSKNGVTTWFHYVLEAKLVTSAGHAISLASEFIENIPGRDYEKQDCEQKAFVRLAARIKKHFPRLPVCILADGLYPNNTVFQICRQNRWHFIITLKDGCLKTFHAEVKLLEATIKKREVCRRDKTDNIKLEYRYLNDIEYDGHKYHWLSCLETKTKHTDGKVNEQKFVYITDVEQDLDNVVVTADGGRLRWKIENEGFNVQKNRGYELEHKFSLVSNEALQNYYQILQIAHAINQFVEKSLDVEALLKEHSGQSIQSLWKDLIVFLKSIPYTSEQLNAFLSD
ncbi:MAG: hypothetical protein KBI42_13240 [Bacteroidia bacterium]|nr:hypothetical protein [Bacteroidia bacterium]